MSDCRFGVSPVNYPDPDPDHLTHPLHLFMGAILDAILDFLANTNVGHFILAV